MRVALDTNILAYAEGVNGAQMKNDAIDLIGRLPQASVVVPVQVLGELFQVLVRKAGRSPKEARAAILSWSDTFTIAETSGEVMLAAADLAVNHRFSLWDVVILSVSAASGCRLLLSEDMQDGFVWNGVTLTNPFGKKRHPLLEAMLK